MSHAPNFYFVSRCGLLRLIILQQLVHAEAQALHAGLRGVVSMLQGTVILKGLKVYQHSHVK